MTDPILLTAQGWSSPCPGCGVRPEKGDVIAQLPKDWRPWHADCWRAYADNQARCRWCGVLHPLPHDGACLL